MNAKPTPQGIEVPDPRADLTGCLEALAEVHGAEWVFHLIGGIRDHRGIGKAGVMRARLARELVDAEMQSAGVDELTAIRVVGERLGYTPAARVAGGRVVDTLTNFRKLVRGVVRTSGKPIEETEG